MPPKEFPPELITVVVKFASQSTLAALCRVNKSTKSIAESVLYRHMVVPADERMATLFESLADEEVQSAFRHRVYTVATLEFTHAETSEASNALYRSDWTLRVADVIAKLGHRFEALECFKWPYQVPVAEDWIEAKPEAVGAVRAMWKKLKIDLATGQPGGIYFVQYCPELRAFGCQRARELRMMNGGTNQIQTKEFLEQWGDSEYNPNRLSDILFGGTTS